MLLSRSQLHAHAFASTDATRPAIGGVHISPEGVATATDGHVMVRVWRKPDGATDADYPPPSPDWTAPVIPADGILIPSKAAADMLKAAPKQGRYAPPVLASVLVESVNGSVTLSATNLDTRPSVSARLADAGQYPIVENVIPPTEREGDTVIYVDAVKAAEFFATLVKIMGKDFGGGRPVRLSVPANARAAIRLDAETDETRVLALLMPVQPPQD